MNYTAVHWVLQIRELQIRQFSLIWLENAEIANEESQEIPLFSSEFWCKVFKLPLVLQVIQWYSTFYTP